MQARHMDRVFASDTSADPLWREKITSVPPGGIGSFDKDNTPQSQLASQKLTNCHGAKTKGNKVTYQETLVQFRFDESWL